MKHSLRSERGSLLIVAMLFSAVVSIALASYLTIATHAMPQDMSRCWRARYGA